MPGQDPYGMSIAARKFEPVGRIAPGDHLALVFDTDAEQLSVVRAYVLDGIRAGHKIFHTIDPNVADGVLLRLLSLGGEISAAADSGQLDLRLTGSAHRALARLDAPAMCEVIRQQGEQARAEGYSGCRVSAEISRLPDFAHDPRRLAVYEHAIQRAFQDHGVSALCQFNRAHFPPAVLEQYSQIHGNGRVRANDLYEDSQVRITPTFGQVGVEIVGKFGGQVEDGAVTAVREACAELTGDVRISLLAAEFSGIGIRALASLAVDMTTEHRRIRFDPAPRELLDLLRANGV